MKTNDAGIDLGQTSEEAHRAIDAAVDDPYSDLKHKAALDAVDRAVQVAAAYAKQAEASAWSKTIALATRLKCPQTLFEAEQLISQYGQDCIRLAFQAQSIQTWSQPCPGHSDLNYLEPIKKWRKANPTHCLGCFLEALDISNVGYI